MEHVCDLELLAGILCRYLCIHFVKITETFYLKMYYTLKIPAYFYQLITRRKHPKSDVFVLPKVNIFFVDFSCFSNETEFPPEYVCNSIQSKLRKRMLTTNVKWLKNHFLFTSICRSFLSYFCCFGYCYIRLFKFSSR